MSEPIIDNTSQEKISEVKSDQLKLEEVERNSKSDVSAKKLPEFNEENRERGNLISYFYFIFYF